MIVISLVLGIILRIYKISSNYFFSGELGKELLYAHKFIESGVLPLIGMPTSHEWLNYGPLYYWILIPLIKLFGNSPYILFWLSLVVCVAGIIITYLVFSKIINKQSTPSEGKRFAIILSFFISLSPLWIWVARLSKLHTFFFVLTPIIIYFLYKIWNKEIKYIFWLGIVFGLLFSFHYSQIPIIIVIVLAFWIRRKSIKIKNYLMFLVGLVIPNITVLINDAQNGFPMIKNLVLWIPYRIAGFTGLYPKNNMDVGTFKSTLSAFNDFFGQNLFWDNRIWILGSVTFLVLFITFIIQNRKKFAKDFFVFYLIASTIAQCIALFIHTTPPIHYFFPIFLNFGLLFSFFACQYWQRRSTKVLTTLIFILMFVAGIFGLGSEHTKDIDYIPLSTQQKVVDYMVSDSEGKPFTITRIGPYDYFPEEYSQNYKYLIKIEGGVIDPSSKLKYIIYDIGEVYVQKYEQF